MLTAMTCIHIISEMKKIPFCKREKEWKRKYEKQVIDEIINPIEEKIKEIM